RETLTALIHRQLRAQHEALAEDFRSGQALERFRRRGFRRDRYPRRKSHHADVCIANFFRNVTRKSANTVFSDHVRAGAAWFHSAAAVKIDNVAGLLPRHVWNHMFGAEKGTVKIGVKDPIPELEGHIGDQRPARNIPGEMRYDGRIV